MNVEEFLKQLTEVLEADEPLILGQDLEELETWDSLGILSVVEFYEQLDIKVDIDAFGEAKTTDDLVAMAAPALS